LFIGTAAATSPKNEFSVVPTKESHLTNAPRIQVQRVLQSSSALGKTDEEEEEEEDDDDNLMMLPPPPPRQPQR
jgi:hypothetical protein